MHLGARLQNACIQDVVMHAYIHIYMWFDGRHHYEQPITVELSRDMDGYLTVACRAISGETILIRSRINPDDTFTDLRKWLDDTRIEHRQDKDCRFYTGRQYIDRYI